MENYKNSKIGQETAQKYGDILEMERPQTEESLRKHPRMTLTEPGQRSSRPSLRCEVTTSSLPQKNSAPSV